MISYKALNTILESGRESTICLNRTFMELKCTLQHILKMSFLCFNRIFMELKFSSLTRWSSSSCSYLKY